MRLTASALGPGNMNHLARMLGHKSAVITLEKYNRYLPNLTRSDGQALLAADEKAKRSGVAENLWKKIQ